MNIWITRLTRHAETFKVAILVQASAFVEARVAVALIDVVLTPGKITVNMIAIHNVGI